MSLPYRSRPLNSEDELRNYYGPELKDEQIPFLQKLIAAKASLREIVESRSLTNSGIVISIEGTWGSGKTSFVKLLCDDLTTQNAAVVTYDSLYYGNASEATNIFIKSIFEAVRDRFGVKLNNGSSMAKNITPKFELSNGLPKITIDYKINRAPTEVIKEQLEVKMKKLPGKMVIVIDDIDRVAAEDTVHFLRIVRVLRELPNVVIILPIDRVMLEALLKTQGIESPRRYLEKIIDMPMDINPEQGSSKDLFVYLMKKRFGDEGLNEEILMHAWDMYLWEISLGVIKESEVQGQQRFILNIGNTDPAWQLLDPTLSLNGESLVRKFFELTSVSYGANANYVFRIKNSNDTKQDIFQHYSQVFANMTFTDLMYGRIFPNLSPDLSLGFSTGDNMLTIKWWNDKESIVNLQDSSDRTIKADYRITLPVDENDLKNYNNDLNNNFHYLWDTVRSLAGAYLPEKSIQYLAPRTLNRVIDNLNVGLEQIQDAKRTEEYTELQRAIRKAVLNTIVFGA